MDRRAFEKISPVTTPIINAMSPKEFTDLMGSDEVNFVVDSDE